MRLLLRLLLWISGLAAPLAAFQAAGFGSRPLLEAALLAMTPLALAAVGESINERAGLVDIGIEGIFLLSALMGTRFAEVMGSGVLGLLAGGLVGALVGLFMGAVSIYARADQIVAGLGINLLAAGLVPYMIIVFWATPGIHLVQADLQVGPLVTEPLRISSVTLAAILIALASGYVLYRTRLGLLIRASGEEPEAVEAAGARLGLLRLFTSAFGGFLAGLGGAFMPLAWFGGMTKEISAGRGFIALACVVSSGLDPLLSLAFAYIFGLAEAFAYTVSITPGVKEVVPYHLIITLPYMVTLATVALFVGRRRLPRALGLVYRRE